MPHKNARKYVMMMGAGEGWGGGGGGGGGGLARSVNPPTPQSVARWLCDGVCLKK